jgi:hypothetical protein
MVKIYLVILSVFLATISATQICIDPIADTYLDQGAPSTAHGYQETAAIFQDIYQTGDQYKLVTMFNISIFFTQTVNPCTITYFQAGTIVDEAYGPVIEFNAYRAYPNWTETSATWNNPPTLMSTTPFVTNYQDYDVEKVIIPCTSSLQSAINAQEALFSVLVDGPGQPAVVVNSRQTSDFVMRPKLCGTF